MSQDTDLQIRPMTFDDLPAVQQIERASFTTPWPPHAYRQELATNRLAHYLVAYSDLFDEEEVGVHRDRFVEAVAAELTSSPDRDGAPLMWSGYVKPLYLLPMYRQRTAYRDGSPFRDGMGQEYGPGLCPVTEDIADRLVRLPLYFSLTAADQDRVIEAVASFSWL